MRLVARLVSVTSSDDVKLYTSLSHCIDELILELVNVLHVGLDDANFRLRCFYHVENLSADFHFVRRLLLEKLAFSVVIIRLAVKISVDLVKYCELVLNLAFY